MLLTDPDDDMARSPSEAGAPVLPEGGHGASRLDPAIRNRGIIAVGAVAVVAWLALFASGLAVQAGWGCTACHVMGPYAQAHSAGPHSSLACPTCHASGGVSSVLADGLRAAGWGMGALVGREPRPVLIPETGCRDCHAQSLQDVTIRRGIAVRHAEFSAQSCGDCHAGTAHLAGGRWYRRLAMDDCMTCHEGDDDPRGCDLCHVGDTSSAVADRFRPSHGPDWLKTHGDRGGLTACGSCHPPRACVECHGVLMPHPRDWVLSHAGPSAQRAQASCVTCHEPGWCTDCHGIAMPHPTTFLAGHGSAAGGQSGSVCITCHDLAGCDGCHFASSHPETAGVDAGHRW